MIQKSLHSEVLGWLRETLKSGKCPKKPDSMHNLGVTADSRSVKEGTIFVAVRGATSDGHLHISEALKKGAVAIVGEVPASELADLNPSLNNQGEIGEIPYLQVGDSRDALAFLAATLTEHPSQGLFMVAITGTSGKTTTSYLIESILKQAGHEVGVIGTINFRYKNHFIDSTHTTPGAVELQALLRQMKDAGCTAVVMEVSSHSLKQKRVGYIAFDAMLFTNLTPEHLDFHKDMEDYFASKAILFKSMADYSISVGKKPVAAVQNEDPYGRRLLEELELEKSALRISSFSTPRLKIDLDGISGSIGPVQVRSSLTGQFNASNIAGAVALTLGFGMDAKLISQGLKDLPGVPGRLEKVPNSRGIHVWVDYAHKPDALEKVLQTLQAIRNQNRLICVVGCGGDRDRAKRPVMGRISVTLADMTWITSDNPRTEPPEAIIEEILGGVRSLENQSAQKGVPLQGRYQVEVDRRKAIFGAIGMAKPGDLVLIAGKGHETYQILGTKKIHFDDKEVVLEALSASNA